MTTHVFIVNSTTFKFHLEFLFAGTGAKDSYVDFNKNQNTDLHHTTENMLSSMIADASRIRRGDKIIFYLQQNFPDKIFEGKFFGIFKAKDDWSFLDNKDDNQYLGNELGKSLTFRAMIEPDKVYSEGVTEWEALDEIKNIQSPNQMLWSLIYRKLKGNRGNTMITIYESERLCQLIRDKNNKRDLVVGKCQISFNQKEQVVFVTDNALVNYEGRKEVIDLLPRLTSKYKAKKSFESHLQAYIVRNIGQGIDKSLDNCILGGKLDFEWLGNEVSCGVGMQRIDIMISLYVDEQRVLLPIELKSVEADSSNVKQIQRYIDWIDQYYNPNRQSDIHPILISRKIGNKSTDKFKEIINSFNDFNIRNSRRCSALRYVEYHLDNNSELIFEEIKYKS